MFNNYYHTKKDLVIIPKHNEQNNFKKIDKVDVKPNNNNKTYENIRNIIEGNNKTVDIEKESKPNGKNNILKNNIV